MLFQTSLWRGQGGGAGLIFRVVVPIIEMKDQEKCPQRHAREGENMNVGNVTGRSTFFHNVAAERPQKPTGQGSAQTAATARTRDRVELQFSDVLTAEKEGYIEVNGNRFTVPGWVGESTTVRTR